MSDLTLRCFRPGDEAHLPDIYRAAVTALGARDYSAAQVAAWAGLAPSPAVWRQRAEDGRCCIVGVDAACPDRVVAYADIEPDGHIDQLYCVPAAAGQGLAGRLLDALEEQAKAWGLARLFAEASETALGAFRSRDFEVSQRRELVVAGVAIHNDAVEKALAPDVACYWRAFTEASGVDGRYDTVSFGDSPVLADMLLALLLEGRKRATASLARDYGSGSPRPAVGDYAVVVDGRGYPKAIWRTTDIRLGPLHSVDAAFAWDEGEGDRTRESWLATHRDCFARQAAAQGFTFSDNLETVFERYAVVWPPAAADEERQVPATARPSGCPRQA
jgi:uncharacterized protein YhfF/GNAT superfamily N-acetyltransferase